MNRPPLLMHMKIQKKGRGFGVWLPVFLVLPLALVVFIILSPLVLIAVLALWLGGWGKRALLALKTAFEVCCSIHGLRVDIQSHHQSVLISVV